MMSQQMKESEFAFIVVIVFIILFLVFAGG